MAVLYFHMLQEIGYDNAMRSPPITNHRLHFIIVYQLHLILYVIDMNDVGTMIC